jgi:hypothetical protein
MSFTYILATDIGKVRLLIPDRVAANAILTDEEIQAFIDMEGEVRYAAAACLETIASDQVLTLKVMSLLDVSTSGDRVSAALLARAKLLREQADGDDDAFDIAEMVVNDFSGRERLYNQGLRYP